MTGKYTILIFAVAFFALNCGAVYANEHQYSYLTINTQAAAADKSVLLEKLKEKVVPSIVSGVLKDSGESVEILEDYYYGSYLTKSADGYFKWVSADQLIIPEDAKTREDKMTTNEIEEFVNLSGYASDSFYFVWVDIARQLVHVFLGREGEWRLYKTMICSTGKNISPTKRGYYKIGDRGEWFYSTFYGSGAKSWVQYSGPYLFHSVPIDLNGNIVDSTLGSKASAGCVRLTLEDARWFYDYVPAGTSTYIN